MDLILSGQYTAGERLPSDNRLVDRFETSRPTVAKAMRQLEDEGYIERRVGSGSFVKFNPRSKPSLIGLLTPEVGDAEIFGPLCNEIAIQCQKKGLSLLWSDSTIHQTGSDHHERVARELCNRFIAQEVSGVFFAPVEFSSRMIEVNREIAHRLDEAGISVVLLDRDLERLPQRSRFDWVGIDNFRAGFLQADHLIENGCRKLAYVTRSSSAPTIDLRIAGFKSALERHQFPIDTNQIIRGDVKSPELVARLETENIDGVACSNDTTANFLLNSLRNAGFEIPQKIRLVGVDDVKIAETALVPLTTIHQPFRLMGKVAVDTMISRIENRTMVPRSIFVDIDLVVRNSCGGVSTQSPLGNVSPKNLQADPPLHSPGVSIDSDDNLI